MPSSTTPSFGPIKDVAGAEEYAIFGWAKLDTTANWPTWINIFRYT